MYSVGQSYSVGGSSDAAFCCQYCSNLSYIYTMIHNYGNPYEKWNIFVARPHLWLQLGMVKPEIMLCEMVLNNVCMLMLDWNS